VNADGPVVGGLLDRHGAVLGMRDQDRCLDLDLPVPDEAGERVEVLRCCIDVRLTADEDIGWYVSHSSRLLSLRQRPIATPIG
jgi:hypothetical protein